MGKQYRKSVLTKPAPITSTQCEEAARSLVRRGLAPSVILDGNPQGDRAARRVAAIRDRGDYR